MSPKSSLAFSTCNYMNKLFPFHFTISFLSLYDDNLRNIQVWMDLFVFRILINLNLKEVNILFWLPIILFFGGKKSNSTWIPVTFIFGRFWFFPFVKPKPFKRDSLVIYPEKHAPIQEHLQTLRTGTSILTRKMYLSSPTICRALLFNLNF